MLLHCVAPAGAAITGVGLELTFDEAAGREGYLIVVTPVAGGPADKAGVAAGDAIAAIDG